MPDIKAQNETALASVKAIYDAADEANTLLDGMQTAATQAGTTLNGIYATAVQAEASATSAQASADEAQESANSAKASATVAFNQLGIVENIVGVLDMIQTHGQYIETRDTDVIEGKRYFVRSGTAPNYEYLLVNNPSGDPYAEGWYELDGIDEAIQNYVSSHLILTNEGLELKRDNSKYKMRLTGDAMEIIAPDGTIVGSHGETIVLGNESDIHFEATSNQIKFSTPNSDLCWFGLNSDGIWEMHIETTYVEKMVRYGDFAFIKRDNGNMSLKWLGE
ncbi:MAG: hypothetical protein J5965_15070 [Aeriscardovia sp.]|nr:hypothetical protein [Aeriscardovia sp.]